MSRFRKECDGKVKYSTRQEAEKGLHGFRHRIGSSSRYTVYKCSHCGSFHFGHEPYKQRNARRRKRRDKIPTYAQKYGKGPR